MGESEGVGGDVSFVPSRFREEGGERAEEPKPFHNHFTTHVLFLLSRIRFRKNEIKNRTYLDEELRIGRGDKGSVFVTARRKKGQKEGEAEEKER